MIKLDHLAYAGATLEEASAEAEAALGVPLSPGGQHDVFHTHNRLMGLEDGLYFEVIAADPGRPKPQRRRWFALDELTGPPHLRNWVCQTDDLEAALAQCPDGAGEIVELSRGDLAWRAAVPASGVLPFEASFPMLIQWTKGGHPSERLSSSGLALRRLTITTPDADGLRAALAPLIADARIVIEPGAASLSAEFQGPNGPVQL